MIKNKIFIEKNNYQRVVITDLLPYETPLIFSNDGFYKYLLDESIISNNWIISTVLKNFDYTLPFNYKIKKSFNSYRTLSVIHPIQQKEFVEFYKDYDFLLISLCNRSSFSLRQPTKVVGQYYEKFENSDEIKASSNYFVYSKYSHMYKFFDSYEFHRLEKKFNYFMSLDISKCFYNIYTHSLCWAVKDKDYAKKNGRASVKSFENAFDKLMQKSNYNETNGIVVGPEISRIFAEIIFQKIDLDIELKLKNIGLIHKVDYDIKRYIDDYFIFVSNQKKLEEIKNIIQESLEYYKLYLNDSKTNITESPFITPITMSKMSISKIINNYFDLFIENIEENENEKIKLLNQNRYYKLSHRMIEHLKKEIKSFNLKYNDVNNYVLKIFVKKTDKFINEYIYKSEDKQSLINFLKFILDVVYFMYPMDVRINTTYNISNLIVSINNFLEKIENKEIIFTIRKKIVEESIFVINKVCNKEARPSLEILNLLLVVSSFGNDYLTMDNEKLKQILHINEETEFTYFQIIILIYFIKNESKYTDLKKMIISIIQEKLSKLNFQKSENFLLFFDMLSCPYLTIQEKRSLLPDSITNKNDIINDIKDYQWFCNWSEINIKRLLYKKELKLAYER